MLNKPDEGAPEAHAGARQPQAREKGLRESGKKGQWGQEARPSLTSLLPRPFLAHPLRLPRLQTRQFLKWAHGPQTSTLAASPGEPGGGGLLLKHGISVCASRLATAG